MNAKDEALRMALAYFEVQKNMLETNKHDYIINACKEALESQAQGWFETGTIAQPLSDDEIRQIIAKEGIPVRTGNTAVRFARAIEQAHGIGVKDGQTI